jgi:hypothetical protein
MLPSQSVRDLRNLRGCALLGEAPPECAEKGPTLGLENEAACMR